MLITLLIFILSSNALTLKRENSPYYSRIAIIGLLYITYLSYSNASINGLSNGLSLYGGLFNISNINCLFIAFISLITSVILILTGFFPRKIYSEKLLQFSHLFSKKLVYNFNAISNKGGEQFRILEYALIIIFVLCGAMFLMSSADLISIFLSIELQSYGLYILSTIYRDSEVATGSGLTYFLLGGLSSCFILLGSALLYVNTGITSLDSLYLVINLNELTASDMDLTVSSLINLKLHFLQYSFIIMTVGFLFKVSAAPFHFWSPDVYDGIPTIVTTFVAIIAKISIFIFLLELVYYTQTSSLAFSWKTILILSSLLSLVVGSVLGLVQFRIKRLLAYSTISHVGFILLALSINSVESIQAYLFYILQYSLSNLNVFIILLTIGYTLYLYVYKDRNKRESLIDENNSPIQLISQLRGYFYVNSFLAISLAITLFSFVGIPPLIGFFAKQMILSAALDNGYVFMSLIAILTSVIGAGYYLNMIKEIFFFKDNYELSPSVVSKSLFAYIKNYQSREETLSNVSDKISLNTNNIVVNSGLSVSISIMTLILTLFIYTPSGWFNLVNILSINLSKI